MKNLTATICLAVALLLGSAGASWSQDAQKGLTAYKSGDYATALREFQPLAKQGNADAQFRLSVTYGLGKGVIQDWVYAHMWGNLAASNGNERGGGVRDVAAKNMTPAELSTAQKLARECVRKKYKGC